jgi:group I intron endonuclease
MGSIYIIKNIMNNKVYVGSTLKSYVFRIKTHINLLNKKKHENPILQNAWNKYGEKNFIFECVENFNEISIDLLLIKENEYIVKYNSCNRNFGYNICSVGKSRIGTKWNDESRKNRQGIGNPMYGKGYLN